MHSRFTPAFSSCLRLFGSLLLVLAALFSAPYSTSHAQAQKGGQQPGPNNPTTCDIGFVDVSASDYYFEPIRSLFCRGAISGYPDGTFRPGAFTTRGQLAKIIAVVQGWPLVSPPVPSFNDVPADSAFYAYVETALAHNAISGYVDGSFRPNANITRSQLSKVVVLAQGWPLVNPPNPSFNDVAPGSTFYSYVETAAQHGAVSGYVDGSFRPGSLATRGQISKIVYYATGGTGLTTEEQQTVDLINQRRAGMGLSTLHINGQLTVSSRRHSYDIGPLGLCQHNGTDGTSPWDRIAQAGYTGFGMGEVVGCNFNSAQGVVDGWWNSPGHYAILTDPNAVDIGCGWWIGSNGYGWQTCDTGDPNS
jgi:uncharacterized protein YkwD